MMNVVNLFASQPDLRLILPTVHGNVDYHEFRLQLEQIDQVLYASGLEDNFIEESVKTWLAVRGGANRMQNWRNGIASLPDVNQLRRICCVLTHYC